MRKILGLLMLVSLMSVSMISMAVAEEVCGLFEADSVALVNSKLVNIDEIKISEGVELHLPVCISDKNVNGKPYTDDGLLRTYFSPKLMNNAITHNADNGCVTFQAENGKFLMYGMEFFINSGSFGKCVLKVGGTDAFCVMVDGVEKSAKTKFDGFSEVTIPLTLNTGCYKVVVKYLSNGEGDSEQKVSAKLQVSNGECAFSNVSRNAYTMKRMMDGQNIVSASASPNGKYILVQINERRGTTTSAFRLLMDAATGKVILKDNGVLMSAKWMPVSDKLYYIEKKGDGNNIVTIDPVNMNESVLAKGIPDGNFEMAADENTLIYSMMESGPKPDKVMIHILDPNDRQSYWRNRNYIAMYKLSTGVLERLTFGNKFLGLGDISKDGKKIVFSVTQADYTKRPFSTTSFFVMDLDSRKVDTIVCGGKYLGGVSFSPDGQKLLFVAGPEAFDGVGLNIKDNQIANSYDNQLFVMDINSRNVKPLTKTFNPSIDHAYWSSTDNKIYALVDDKDCKRVYVCNPDNVEWKALSIPEDYVKSFSKSSASSVLVAFGQSASNSDRLYYLKNVKTSPNLIMDISAEKLKDVELAEVHDWNFTASDGTVIEGRYYLPPHFDAAKKYPMLVYYYGGTTPTVRMLEFTYSMHLYAAQGYVVYTLNPSGTIGYGQEFSARHVNAWGIKTADEIIMGTKLFAEKHPFVNAKKIGCFGASYGGFMTQYLQTKTDIFAAAISHAGISAISSYWGEGYWGIGYCSCANADSYPWNNSKLFVEQSPLFNADKINTPLLLLHGTSDTNVPIGESIQMYNALRILGKTVEFIEIEGENHHISDYPKRLKWNDTMMAWFAKWLQDNNSWWESLYPSVNL